MVDEIIRAMRNGDFKEYDDMNFRVFTNTSTDIGKIYKEISYFKGKTLKVIIAKKEMEVIIYLADGNEIKRSWENALDTGILIKIMKGAEFDNFEFADDDDDEQNKIKFTKKVCDLALDGWQSQSRFIPKEPEADMVVENEADIKELMSEFMDSCQQVEFKEQQKVIVITEIGTNNKCYVKWIPDLSSGKILEIITAMRPTHWQTIDKGTGITIFRSPDPLQRPQQTVWSTCAPPEPNTEQYRPPVAAPQP